MTLDLKAIFGTPRDAVAYRALEALHAGPLLLVGPPGTGKTSAAFEAAATLGLEARIAHSDPGALADKYVGGYKPRAGVWDWVDGVILDSMRRGCMLIVDDLHLMGPDGQSALYQACDFGPGSTFSLDDGTNVTPAPGYRVVATMNGDPSRLDDAVRSRFRNIIPVLEPSTVMTAQLVQGQCPKCGMTALGQLDCAACGVELDINCTLMDACTRDYQAGSERIGQYREWQALAVNLHSGAPLNLAVAWAFLDGDGTAPQHYERCQKVLKALHTAAFPGAAEVMAQLVGQLPSGAPSMAIGA